jgi:2',3'-cyclic-nucleotide 2'-phosphodiesterase (5'-nucleotidase family)
MAEQISELVDESQGLYFDSGDCIKTGNLGIPLKEDPVWELLEIADCSASVPGNRESHILRSVFEAKISGHRHPLLCANMRERGGELVLPKTLLEDYDGKLKIGVFGVMVPMVTAKMKTQAASAFLWDPPIEAAIEVVKELHQKCDLLIALTHIGIAQDRELAARCPEIDIILGGHSHTFLEQPERIGSTWICQGGSHGRYVGRYVWEKGKGIVEAELIPLNSPTVESAK